ncbi:MAG: HlyD family efflux transporter periplasmic adaptor subunit [Acidiferrobacter sp.]
MHVYLKRIALIAFCATLAACSRHRSEAQDQPLRVRISHAILQTTPEIESAVGNIGQGLAPIITAPVSGQLTQILVVPGEAVQNHQVLARMRPGSMGQKADRSDDIRAPASGIITQILVRTGSPAHKGARIFGFSGPQVRKARVPFPLSFAAQLHSGESVSLHSPLAPRSPVDGKISRLDSHPKHHVIYAVIDLPPRHGWATGSPVRADVIVAQRQTIVVPRTSIALRTVGTVVFVIDHRTIHIQRVHVGERLDDAVVITSGLSAGTAIVTDASPALTNGAQVTTIKAERP